MAPAEGSARLERAQRDGALKRAIDEALTERQREALLATLGGLPMVEVARRIGSTRGALYKLLHDARLRLRAHLEAEGAEAQGAAEQEGLGSAAVCALCVENRRSRKITIVSVSPGCSQIAVGD